MGWPARGAKQSRPVDETVVWLARFYGIPAAAKRQVRSQSRYTRRRSNRVTASQGETQREGRPAAQDSDVEPPVYSADQVRGGEFILPTRTCGFIFIAGVIALVIAAIAMQFVRI